MIRPLAPDNQIGSVTLNGVSVNGGIFTVQLDFGAAAFPGADRWLGISVDGGPALAPRVPITSVPYAIHALTAEGLAGGDLTGTYPNPTIAANKVDNTKLTSDSASLAKVSGGAMAVSGGKIGIGTNNPATLLHVKSAGDPQISLESSDPGNPPYSGRHWALQSSGTSNAATAGTFQIVDRTIGSARLIIYPDGRVEIPSAPRTIYGSVNADGTILNAGSGDWTVIPSGSGGLYIIYFNTPFSAPPVVTATARAEFLYLAIATVVPDDQFHLTEAQIGTFRQAGNNILEEDNAFDFTAIGPK